MKASNVGFRVSGLAIALVLSGCANPGIALYQSTITGRAAIQATTPLIANGSVPQAVGMDADAAGSTFYAALVAWNKARLARLLSPNLPAAPDAVDWSPKVAAWGMMRNDTIGDCTCAAAGHMIECWTANAGQEITPTDTQIISAYGTITGYTPRDPDSDQGAAEIDVLNYWRKKGIAGHKLLGYAALDPRNVEHVKQSVYLFGGTYIGLQLPLSAQDQDVWDLPASGPTGDGTPGSWGGHAVCVVAYDATGLWVVTWGALKRMTWAFWAAYCDEAYAIFSTDMLADGKSPIGFDLTQLQADLAEIGSVKLTTPTYDLRHTTYAPATHESRLSAHDTPDLAIVIFTGFGADPAGDCDGMRALAQKIAAQDSAGNVPILAFGYDQTPPAPYSASPDGLCRWIKDQIIALAPKRIISLRHSFGGALGVFFDQWLWNWYSGPEKLSPPFAFEQVVFFDPVPNPVRFGQGQHANWFVPLTIAPNVLCFFQREGLLLGIKGEPILQQPGVTNINVTAWTNPQLAHIDFLWLTGIINDLRVQAMTLSTLSLLRSRDPACGIANHASI